MFWMRQLMLKGPAASALFYFAVAAPLQGQRYIRRRAYRTGFTITGASECEGHRKTLRAMNRVQTTPNSSVLGSKAHHACSKEAFAHSYAAKVLPSTETKHRGNLGGAGGIRTHEWRFCRPLPWASWVPRPTSVSIAKSG